MKIGMVGLGRMGANMTKRLIEHGHDVVAFDRSPEAVAASERDGAVPSTSLRDLVDQLDAPRAVWVMVPAGAPTVETVEALSQLLEAGDTIIDGGNSPYRNAQEASARLLESGVRFVDAGVSGGVWGLKNGYCLMVGGERAAVEPLEPIFSALAPPDGYAHVGPSGAGHFTKMVHNGIEYGLLQAYAEGFALLESADELSLDLHQLAKLWNHGSVVRSWLLELAELALSDDDFASIRGYVEDSGEGRWTVEEGVRRSVAMPVITASLFARFSSRQPDAFSARIVAALRNQFGGHKFFTESEGGEQARGESRDATASDGPQSVEGPAKGGDDARGS